MNSIVIIADIVDSKKISARKEVQLTLKDVLIQINHDSENGILSPFTITLGDEFQAVYRCSATLIKDLFLILVKLFPVRIRFSIGFGKISTEINEHEAIGMDGPAITNQSHSSLPQKGLPGLKSSMIRISQSTF